MSTQLNNYQLYFDGSIAIDPSNLHKFISKVDPGKLFVTHTTPDLEKYNKLVLSDKRIRTRDSVQPTLPTPFWLNDHVYQCTDAELRLHMCKLLSLHCDGMTDDYKTKAVIRFQQEWELFSRKGMFLLLRVLMNIINTLNKKSIPWGPGRGSSTSSFLLFLIGLHNVDCVLYDVDVTDFIR